MAFALAGSTGGYGGGGGFSAYAPPTGGQGAFGKVPGQTGIPPSLYQQALGNVPGLGQNAGTASSDIQAMLQGQLAPDTEKYIDRLVAAKGVNQGTNSSPFNTADLIYSLGLTSEQQVMSGLGAYNNLLNTVGQLQENPALMSEIAQQNAMLGAAPDPTAAHNQILQDLQDEFSRFSGNPAGSTGGWGKTTLLGPTPGAGGGGGGNWWDSNPWGSDNTPVFVGGGPGVGASASTPLQNNTWQDYLKSTFGGANYGYQPASGTGMYDQSSLESANSLYGDTTDYSQAENAPQ